MLYFYKTPLYVAVEVENVEIVKLLLEKENIDINLLCILRYYFVIQLLLFCLNEITKCFFKKAALHVAVEKENIEIVKLLLKNQKTDINLLCIFRNGFLMKYQFQNM